MSPPIFGLYYYIEHRRVSLPLLNVDVEASIKELAAQVKLTQTYGNDAAFSIQASYLFPIPARASVCSFTMIKQDGTRVVGSVQEKQEARETYNTAVSQGQQASLMEQQTPDAFQVAVGNIPPKEQVKIELVYATELSEDEENDSVRFHLPVHVGSRYGSPPTTSLNNPFTNPFFPTTWKTPFLHLIMSIESLAPISKIGCPSHAVSTELGPDPKLPNFKELTFSNYARVSLSSDSALNKDFVLTVKSAGLDTPRCIAELHPSRDTVAMALTLVPRFKLPDLTRQEFVFLVDRSGSMQGARVAAARKALVIMLRSLPHKDSLFQIRSFGNGCTALWERGSKPYNQETLEQATRHVDGMLANYGGTEIRGALKETFAARKLDRPTSVFVLTDGEAWDLDAVLKEVKTAVASARGDAPLRVSVLGIGDSVSTAMCEGIARVGNGTCLFVGEQETSFTGKVARMLKAAKTPLISNITVDWGRSPAEDIKAAESEDDFEMVEEPESEPAAQTKKILDVFDGAVDPMQVDETSAPPAPSVTLSSPSPVQQSPYKIRNLFPGIRLNVYAILQGRDIPESVILKGSTEEGAEIELPIPVTLSHLQNDLEAPPAVHALAARKIIQDLEDGQHGLVAEPDLLAHTVKASIVRLGKTYCISSKHTSFVAIDEATPESAPPVVVYQAPPPTPPRVLAAHVGRPKMKMKRAAAMTSATSPSPPPPAPSAGAPPRRPSGALPPPPPFRAPPPPAPLARKKAATPDLSSYNYGAVSSLVLTADRSSLPSRAAQEEAATDDSDPLVTLARMQSFDGCFSVEVFAFVKLKTDMQAVRALFPTGVSDGVVASILAMAFLSTKLGADIDRDSWEGMHEKAKEYVEETLSAMGVKDLTVEGLETEVAKMLA
ncbi:von Willebrand factor type A domain-containing protein [Mycena crocata]|nr:von Willebrand factor type A domain-containing protein [Mycena crocata]